MLKGPRSPNIITRRRLLGTIGPSQQSKGVRMRGLRVAAILGLFVALTLGPTAAGATVDRHTNSDWHGVTDQGGDVKILVLRVAPGQRDVGNVNIVVTYVCDGHEGTTSFGFN